MVQRVEHFLEVVSILENECFGLVEDQELDTAEEVLINIFYLFSLGVNLMPS